MAHSFLPAPEFQVVPQNLPFATKFLGFCGIMLYLIKQWWLLRSLFKFVCIFDRTSCLSCPTHLQPSILSAEEERQIYLNYKTGEAWQCCHSGLSGVENKLSKLAALVKVYTAWPVVSPVSICYTPQSVNWQSKSLLFFFILNELTDFKWHLKKLVQISWIC